MTKYCYLNGKIIPQNKAGISLRDIGILRGFGAFEFLRTYNGKPFLLKEHIIRLKNSAKTLNLEIPIATTAPPNRPFKGKVIPTTPEKQLVNIIEKLLIKNKFRESGIRMILTGGKTTDLLGVKYNYNSPTFFILIDELKELPKSFYQKGVKLTTYKYQREIPYAKTINYITAIKLQNLCKRKKAFDILYTWNGFLLEATTSNFFIFKKNTLLTPKDNVLSGTIRNFVVKLAKNKFKIEEKDISLKELKKATEAFITSTTKAILPVVKIDNKLIGKGKVGKNTKYLMDLFHQYTKNY